MYSLEVVPVTGAFKFRILDNGVEVSHGYRPTEHLAHRDGAEELQTYRLFNVGKPLRNELT